MYKLAYNDDLTFNGFYKEGINKEIPSRSLNIDTSLWNYLLVLNEFKIKKDADLSKEIYTLEDADIFEAVVQEQPKPKPSELEIEIAQMTLDLANKDLQIRDLETQQAQSFLEVAKKDVEIKNLQNDIANVIMQLAIQGGK